MTKKILSYLAVFAIPFLTAGAISNETKNNQPVPVMRTAEYAKISFEDESTLEF